MEDIPLKIQVRFESKNYQFYYVHYTRNSDGRLRIVPDQPRNDIFEVDSTFFTERGLAANDDSMVSFNMYEGYIRHRNFQVWLEPNDGTDLFKLDATFRPIPGLAAENDEYMYSFESMNYPGRYLRHRDFQLWLESDDGTDLFKLDATFRVEFVV